jgi:hypothetical protein
MVLMQKQRVEKWVWILVYGGLLSVSLGWFVQPGSDGLGWALMLAGAAAAAGGIALIFVRSRMGP